MLDQRELMTDEEAKEMLGLSDDELVANREDYMDRARQRAATATNPVVTIPKSDGTVITIMSAQLALEIAMYGEELEALADIYGVHVRQLRRIIDENALLRKEIEDAQKEIKSSSRLKLRMRDVAETCAFVLPELLTNPATPPNVQVTAYTLVARLAGLLDTKDDGPQKAPVQINIFGMADAGKEILPVQGNGPIIDADWEEGEGDE